MLTFNTIICTDCIVSYCHEHAGKMKVGIESTGILIQLNLNPNMLGKQWSIQDTRHKWTVQTLASLNLHIKMSRVSEKGTDSSQRVKAMMDYSRIHLRTIYLNNTF